MTRAVSDTSVLIALAACESLILLDALFTEVRVPSAVFGEATRIERPWADLLSDYLQDKVVQVDVQQAEIDTGDLNAGEVEAIALCKVGRFDILLVDDLPARHVAIGNGLRIGGSLGVLIDAKRRGLIDAIGPRIERALAAGIYYTDSLIAEALRLAGES